MKNCIIFTLIILVAWSARAQDERYFRQIFSGELLKGANRLEDKKYSYLVHSPFYSLDLNNDGTFEQFVYAKKDSEDWVELFSENKGIRTKIFSYRLETKGYGSDLFKIQLKKLSGTTSIVLLYFYEGLSRYTELNASSRIYALTIDNGDLKTLSAFKGPSLFEEFRSFKGHYHLRDYQIYVQDLNNDNIKELIVKHREVSQVFLYQGSGKWKTFSN